MTGRFGLGITNCRPTIQVIEGIRRAEELGAEVAFVAEDINCRNAFELLAVGATMTRRIQLATGVVNPYTRNPTALAMAIATLDELSDGRAILGLGTSSPSLIQEQMGIATGKSVQVMREATEIVRALLSGEPVSYDGESFRYREAQLEVTPVQPQLPIYFAAMGPLTLRLAGRLADGVLLNVGASPEYVRWAVSEIRSAATGAGRKPDAVTIAAWLSTYVTDDREAGLRRAREWLAGVLSIPRQGELLLERGGEDVSVLKGIREHFTAYPHRGDRAAAAQYVPLEMVERLAVIGAPEEARARVEEYRAAGVEVPVMGLAALEKLFQGV